MPPEPTPTSTPIPTSAPPTPSPTPVPTSTPFPTATPTPTSTPIPYPTSTPTPPPIPLPGAYYDCQCLGGLRDITGNGLAFVETGSPGLTTGKCHDGRSVSDGNWFSRSSAAIFNPGASGPLTISMWFKPTTLSGTQALFEKAGEYQATLEAGKLIFRIATTSSSGWDKVAEYTASFSTGVWYQIVAWIVPESQIGVVVGSGTPVTSALSAGEHAYSGGGAVYLAHSPSSAGADLDGFIDEIAFISASLSTAQRAATSFLFFDPVVYDWRECSSISPEPCPTMTPQPTSTQPPTATPPPFTTPTLTPGPTSTPPPTTTPPPTPTATPPPTLPPQPIPMPGAYYDCQCLGGLRDITGNGLALGETGSPGLTTGKCHEGRSVSNGNWFSRASSSTFNPGSSGPLTISFWFRTSTLSSAQVLFEKAGEYQATVESDKLTFRIATTSSSGWDKVAEFNASFSTGVWYHVVAWIVPESLIGVAVDDGTSVTTTLSSGEHAYAGGGIIYFGHSPSGGAADLDGIIDEIAFIGASLTPGQRTASNSLFFAGPGNGWLACSSVSPEPCPTSTPQPTATPTPSPTGTPWPTEPPPPTSTPPPTATPGPPPTPSPTPAPTPFPTDPPYTTIAPTPMPSCCDDSCPV